MYFVKKKDTISLKKGANHKETRQTQTKKEKKTKGVATKILTLIRASFYHFLKEFHSVYNFMTKKEKGS